MAFNIPLLLALVGYHEPFGKDADLIPKKEHILSITPPSKEDPFSSLTEFFITLHQQHLSPTTGPRSNFRPTSSKYMFLSIRRHGFLQGFLQGCDRLLRENDDPWCYRTIVIDNIEYKFDPSLPLE